MHTIPAEPSTITLDSCPLVTSTIAHGLASQFDSFPESNIRGTQAVDTKDLRHASSSIRQPDFSHVSHELLQHICAPSERKFPDSEESLILQLRWKRDGLKDTRAKQSKPSAKSKAAQRRAAEGNYVNFQGAKLASSTRTSTTFVSSSSSHVIGRTSSPRASAASTPPSSAVHASSLSSRPGTSCAISSVSCDSQSALGNPRDVHFRMPNKNTGDIYGDDGTAMMQISEFNPESAQCGSPRCRSGLDGPEETGNSKPWSSSDVLNRRQTGSYSGDLNIITKPPAFTVAFLTGKGTVVPNSTSPCFSEGSSTSLKTESSLLECWTESTSGPKLRKRKRTTHFSRRRRSGVLTARGAKAAVQKH
ncbi:hypothetical protein BU17DRAFT_69995 [Hysterangium stoloniferum]|nr:hypothetical protein BU17DRAFT_69995 [Hysterangium stoloniferum]